MREQLGAWSVSALMHGAFMVAVFVWPAAPEVEPDWAAMELVPVTMARLEIPAPLVVPPPEPLKPEEKAREVSDGGEAKPAAAPGPAPKPERVRAKPQRVREAAPVVVERTEGAAAPVAEPVAAAEIAPAEPVAVAALQPQQSARVVGERSDGGGGGEGPVGIGGGEDRAGLLKEYRRAIYKAVDGRKQYPALARRARLSGVVHVAVVVDGAGKILEVSVERSSGHEVLDEAACEVVRGMGAIPAPPVGLAWTRQKIVIPVKYLG